MTFDLSEGHDHVKLVLVILLTKFGSPKALFYRFLTPEVPGDPGPPIRVRLL